MVEGGQKLLLAVLRIRNTFSNQNWNKMASALCRMHAQILPIVSVSNNSDGIKLYEGYNPFATKPGQPAQNIYVYFGASQDRKQESKKPYHFEMIKMISAGYSILKEVEVIGQPSVNLI